MAVSHSICNDVYRSRCNACQISRVVHFTGKSAVARNVSCCVALFSLILTQINSIAYSARQREIVSHDIVLVIRAFMAYIWSILERNSVTWLP